MTRIASLPRELMFRLVELSSLDDTSHRSTTSAAKLAMGKLRKDFLMVFQVGVKYDTSRTARMELTVHRQTSIAAIVFRNESLHSMFHWRYRMRTCSPAHGRQPTIYNIQYTTYNRNLTCMMVKFFGELGEIMNFFCMFCTKWKVSRDFWSSKSMEKRRKTGYSKDVALYVLYVNWVQESELRWILPGIYQRIPVLAPLFCSIGRRALIPRQLCWVVFLRFKWRELFLGTNQSLMEGQNKDRTLCRRGAKNDWLSVETNRRRGRRARVELPRG